MHFTLHRDSGQSVLREVRSKGHKQDDFLTVYPARIPNEQSIPLKITADLKAQGETLLFIDEKGVFINGSVFETLHTQGPHTLAEQKLVVVFAPGQSTMLRRVRRFFSN